MKVDVQGHPRATGGGGWAAGEAEEEIQPCLCDSGNFSEEASVCSNHSKGRRGGSEEQNKHALESTMAPTWGTCNSHSWKVQSRHSHWRVSPLQGMIQALDSNPVTSSS